MCFKEKEKQMKNKKYQTILFDLDGTLADSDQMIIETMHILYDKYRNGVYTPVEKIYYFSGPPIKNTLKNEFPDLDNDFIFNEFAKESFKLYKTHIFQYPHSKDVLLDLKKEGFKLGIVTNKKHDLTEYCLECMGLDHIFDAIIAIDDVKIPKPNQEGILKAMNELGGSLQTTLYIGDNKSDFDSANNAHVDCCLVSWGPRILDPNLNPAFKIGSYLELKEHLYE